MHEGKGSYEIKLDINDYIYKESENRFYVRKGTKVNTVKCSPRGDNNGFIYWSELYHLYANGKKIEDNVKEIFIDEDITLCYRVFVSSVLEFNNSSDCIVLEFKVDETSPSLILSSGDSDWHRDSQTIDILTTDKTFPNYC